MTVRWSEPKESGGALDPHEVAEQERAFGPQTPPQVDVELMFQALVKAHGANVVGAALCQVRDHLIGEETLRSPMCIREDAIEEHTRKFPIMSPAVREAWKLTHGDRRAAYGTPADVFAGYAKIWSVLLRNKLREGVELDAADATLIMTALKLARQAENHKADNVVDALGYLILHDEVLEQEEPK